MDGNAHTQWLNFGFRNSYDWNVWNGLWLTGGFDLADEPPVSRLPEWTATAGGTWKICDFLKWTLDGQFIDEMYAYSVRSSDEVAELRELDAGFLLNTRLAVPLASFTPFGGELYASLENLTNSHYAYYPGYPMDGIMWYLGCKFKF